MNTKTENILNVTLLEPKMKHPTIFVRFDELKEGESLTIHNDHDPKPLYYQFLGERGNVFIWEYLEEGPDWWRVRITKRLSGEKDETLEEIAAKDKRKVAVFTQYGLDYSCDAKKTVKEACAEKALDVTLIEKELQNKTTPNQENSNGLPAFILQTPAEQIVELDVRPVIQSGKDPIQIILDQVNKMQAGQILKLINIFEPIPLRTLLGKRGFASYADQVSENLIITYFYQNDDNKNSETENTQEPREWDQAFKKYEGNTVVLDVREMEMPKPMMAILDALDQLPSDKALFVYHKKFPVFLIPELNERHITYQSKAISANEIHLLLYKNN